MIICNQRNDFITMDGEIQKLLEDCSLRAATNPCSNDFNMANDALAQERTKIEEAIKNKQITPGRAKLQLWLYRPMRIVITDGRILVGIFLCTDSEANVILGVCSEFTKDGEDERLLGLVMVPGRHIVAMHLDNRCMTNTVPSVS